jgi:hypothetical protein
LLIASAADTIVTCASMDSRSYCFLGFGGLFVDPTQDAPAPVGLVLVVDDLVATPVGAQAVLLAGRLDDPRQHHLARPERGVPAVDLVRGDPAGQHTGGVARRAR